MYVGVCAFEFSDARSDEPAAKQAKLDDITDLSGGLPSMLKTKVTEVLGTCTKLFFIIDHCKTKFVTSCDYLVTNLKRIHRITLHISKCLVAHFWLPIMNKVYTVKLLLNAGSQINAGLF